MAFHDERHLVQVVQRIVSRMGRRVDETCPWSMPAPRWRPLNAIIPPLALDGPLVSIRRFGARPLMSSRLWPTSRSPPEMLQFLAACVDAG